MRFLSLSALFFALRIDVLFAAEHAFVLYDIAANQFLIEEGDLSSYKSPYCTFNIVLSLIGFDTKILQDPENPVWPFEDRYETEYKIWSDSFPERWKGIHSPKSWMKNSTVWYGQNLARILGMKTLRDYVIKFSYGNQNLEGDRGAKNGLTHSWLGSTLRISPLEQVLFINRLVRKELPVTEHAYASTKTILFAEELANGTKLYGKTGGGDYASGREEPKAEIRWFVGWAEQAGRKVTFAYMIQATENNEQIPGIAAREALKERLEEILSIPSLI